MSMEGDASFGPSRAAGVGPRPDETAPAPATPASATPAPATPAPAAATSPTPTPATPAPADTPPPPAATAPPTTGEPVDAGAPSRPGPPAEPTPSRPVEEVLPRSAAKTHHRSFLRELPGIIITALVISVLIKTFLVQAFYIPSGSMENTLLINDRVLVNKLADKPDEIHRGDVVVFRDPGGWLNEFGALHASTGVGGIIHRGLVFVGLAPAVGEEDLIKRVIGVGGDHVVCCNDVGKMTVDGVALTETYLFPGDDPSAQEFDVTVPKGKIWVMGDHRSVSEDSRAHNEQHGTSGFVPVTNVIGRAFTIVWPLERTKLLRTPDTFTQLKRTGAAP